MTQTNNYFPTFLVTIYYQPKKNSLSFFRIRGRPTMWFQPHGFEGFYKDFHLVLHFANEKTVPFSDHGKALSVKRCSRRWETRTETLTHTRGAVAARPAPEADRIARSPTPHQPVPSRVLSRRESHLEAPPGGKMGGEGGNYSPTFLLPSKYL